MTFITEHLMLRRRLLTITTLLAVSAAPLALAVAPVPAPVVPAGLQLPFQPDAELMARLRTGSCWSEYRLYDPVTKTLGEVLALEWYDKLNEGVAKLYLRQDTKQREFVRNSVRYKAPTSKTWRTVTGDEGPDSEGTAWTASYAVGGKVKGSAVMTVIDGTPDADEHVSTGVLTLRGVLASPVNVAHSAGCNRS